MRLFWRVTLPFLAGYFVSYVFRSINAIVGPDLAREFALSAADLGLLSGIFFFAFAAFQLPLGLLLDRYGPRRVNAALLMIAALGGLAFSLAQSPAQLTAARALIGVGVSGCLMSAFSAFALWHPPERIATMNGVAFAAGMLGAMVVTVPLEVVLRYATWREAFQGIAALTVGVSLLLWLAVPEKPSARRSAPLAAQLRELAGIARDPVFRRVALCIATSQLAAVSLATLWVATWLRDVAGLERARVAEALLLFNVVMIGAYLGFGRASDLLARRGRSTLPLMAAGVAVSSACLGLLALGVRTGSTLLWAAFFCAASAVVLSYSLYARRHPKEMAGRANTAMNVCAFAGMFVGQWGVGAILHLWPQTASGYAPEAYPWALGALWLAQAAGLAWLWSGRRLLD